MCIGAQYDSRKIWTKLLASTAISDPLSKYVTEDRPLRLLGLHFLIGKTRQLSEITSRASCISPLFFLYLLSSLVVDNVTLAL